VDVAREAADVIPLEEGLDVLETEIVEGRKTFANTLKYIMMGTGSNFGNMFSVPAALFLVPFLPMKPVQILLNNLLYDFAQVTIPTDKVDYDVMLYVFHADAALFQTGWFVESLATQTLVIHVIRSRHSILKSRASLALTVSSLGVVAIGSAIPYTPIGHFFGFVPLPAAFFAVLLAMTVAYLAMVNAVKRVFYKKGGVWRAGI